MKNLISDHPILPNKDSKIVKFTFDGIELKAFENMAVSSALFMNDIKIFGEHYIDHSPQGIFCANGQCAQCTLIIDGKPQKSCMIPLKEDMVIQSCKGVPDLPASDKEIKTSNISIIKKEVVIIGGGPAGLSAAKILGENGVEVLLIDDKDRLGGKLVLQTHKFFGSSEDVYAGTRGIEIAEILSNEVRNLATVEIWLQSTALACFSDKLIGILKDNQEYVLIRPKYLLISTGAREKMLTFKGNTLPGVYGAGAFQTLVNRDMVKASNKIFIVGGGNVGLIAGYHAIQAGIEVIGLVEALPQCGGYKVHEDKLHRSGVPIFTSHTIISANGESKVKSVTIAKLDKSWHPIPNSEKTFECDTILIAVGLSPVDEFYKKAKEFGFNVWVAGDAEEIAEASAAIFTGRIAGVKILETLGIETGKDIKELETKAQIMKSRPPPPTFLPLPEAEEGIFPVIHCTQEIPCDPCTKVCARNLIKMSGESIISLPFFTNEQECSGCGKCVAVCPGLAITLVDYRKDPKFAFVTIPFEMGEKSIKKGDIVHVMSNTHEIGDFPVENVRILKGFSKTELVTVKIPKEVAKEVTGIQVQKSIVHEEPMEIYHKEAIEDEAIVCRCERVTAGEIRKWIRRGVTDMNELKAITRAGMGACGGKTCNLLILRIFKEEGIEKVVLGTPRPLFVEVPLGVFANVKENDD
ncbi:MAG: FAD-dependent oxidoreductase [Candidatus Heimdallarchaeota archaeon]|nr:FAD-dependent oxidoreductase [Candidatus Heimdallarchaeota archaeon]